MVLRIRKNGAECADLRTAFKSRSRAYFWMGMAGVIIVFPAIILINLKFLGYPDKFLWLLAFVSLAAIFWLIRKVQKEPDKLIQSLKDNASHCENLLRKIS
jgi:FtsH-binding integral membrane protein